jgi:anti-anti-sigma regulatory factor
MFEQKCQGAVDVISGGDRISGEHVAELGALLALRVERGQPQIVLDLQGVAVIDSAGLEL